ncbi:MAG: hypothetical protein L6425_09500 [Candidatus Aminicenantes bacterium]|nr:hypothetical protein [Candidatus Aminicenantes bacterium]
MKKTLMLGMALLLATSGFLTGQAVEADQAYIQAVTAKDLNQQVSMLKDYLNKYAGQATKYENFVYATLCTAQVASITAEERIQYGEKAISLGGLDDLMTYQVNMIVAAMLVQKGQTLDKAKGYANKSIQIAKTAKTKESERDNTARWDQMIGAGNYTLGQVLEKANDAGGAVSAYISSYTILKNPQIVADILKLGKALYDAKNYKSAEGAFKIGVDVRKDYGSLSYYGRCLYRNGKKTEALKIFKQAYAIEKNGEIAYNIGIILAGQAKTDSSVAGEAIQYLLDTAFLSEARSQTAMALAQGLFFNNAHKDLQYNQKVQELTQHSNKITEFTNAFNSKFGDKEEEDLTDAEKKEMGTILANIESEKKAVARLQGETQVALDKFNQAIVQAKQRLGIK